MKQLVFMQKAFKCCLEVGILEVIVIKMVTQNYVPKKRNN